MKIVLTEEDFTKLTKGQVVEKDSAEIILQDIGYDNMLDIIENNKEESDNNDILTISNI